MIKNLKDRFVTFHISQISISVIRMSFEIAREDLAFILFSSNKTFSGNKKILPKLKYVIFICKINTKKNESRTLFCTSRLLHSIGLATLNRHDSSLPILGKSLHPHINTHRANINSV